MLEHFHGLQYRDTHQTLYQGLDVEKDIAERTVTPGQFFVLKFDFSPINCSPNFEQADRALKARITNSLKKFYITYAMYWDVDELSKNIDPENPAESLWACVEAVNDLLRKARERDDKRLAGIWGVIDSSLNSALANIEPQIYLLVDEYDTFSNVYLEPNNTAWEHTWEDTAVEQTFKSFWSMVKLLLADGIERAFVTGISPLSLTGVGSVARNLSLDEDVAGLCGLTRADIEDTLQKICGLETYEYHFSVLQ